MDVSMNGTELVGQFEGERLNAYDDATGRVVGINDKVIGTLTIGFGHTGQDVYKGMQIDHEQALRFLKQDLKDASNDVQRAIDTGNINFYVNQNMFDALVSFDFNLGYSNLVKLCYGRTPTQVSEHITAYVNAGSVWEEGLTKRRNAEKDLFLTPCENVSRETIQNEGDSYMSKKYYNGTTEEPVYSDYNLTNLVGKLSIGESCEAIADYNGRIAVMYNGLDINKKPCKKVGFVKYRGGL